MIVRKGPVGKRGSLGVGGLKERTMRTVYMVTVHCVICIKLFKMTLKKKLIMTLNS